MYRSHGTAFPMALHRRREFLCARVRDSAAQQIVMSLVCTYFRQFKSNPNGFPVDVPATGY